MGVRQQSEIGTMVAFLVIALFVTTTLVVLAALADSAVRGRNAWKAIRRELANDQTFGLPATDAVVVQMRIATNQNDAAPLAQPVRQTPRAVAA